MAPWLTCVSRLLCESHPLPNVYMQENQEFFLDRSLGSNRPGTDFLCYNGFPFISNSAICDVSNVPLFTVCLYFFIHVVQPG